MYIPNYFKQQNIEEVKRFLHENSFGILISQGNDKIAGTHIPMELDTDEHNNDILIGHIAKANPQSKNLVDDLEVLAIFNGPHTYVSSSWYEQENVPTWNYIAVHVYGSIKVLEGDALLALLKKQVDKYEHGAKNPVSVETMSDKTLQQMKGIVGFSIKVNEIQAACKLSQNRNERDHLNIAQKLEKRGDVNSLQISEEMKKNKFKE